MDNNNQLSKILAVVDLEQDHVTREQVEKTIETYILGGVHIEAARLGDKVVLLGRRRTEVVH